MNGERRSSCKSGPTALRGMVLEMAASFFFPKSLSDKGLGPAGRAATDVSPYAITTYDNKKKLLKIVQIPLDNADYYCIMEV